MRRQGGRFDAERAEERAALDAVRQDVELMLTLVTEPRRFGNTYRARCPIHQGDSLSWSARRRLDGVWMWRCFRCNEGGDVLDLMQRLGTPFKTALRDLGVTRDRKATEPRRTLTEVFERLKRPLSWWEQPGPSYRGSHLEACSDGQCKGCLPVPLRAVCCDGCGATKLMDHVAHAGMFEKLDPAGDEIRWTGWERRDGRERVVCPDCALVLTTARAERREAKGRRRAA